MEEEGDDGDFSKQDPSTWEAWDLCRSLFDNHVSETMEDNLEYMWKTYGFYLPDSKYLKDPEGLLQYLGAKMQYGHLPLYESGLNPDAKQLKTLHGVQRRTQEALKKAGLGALPEQPGQRHRIPRARTRISQRACVLVNSQGEQRCLLAVDLDAAGLKLLDQESRDRAYGLHVFFVGMQVVGGARMVVPDQNPDASRVARGSLENRLDVGQSAPPSNIGHHQQIDFREVEILRSLRAKPIAVEGRILMNVGRETTTEPYDRAGEQPLQSHARCQRVEVGGLMRGDQLHVPGSSIPWRTRSRST